MKTTRPAHRGIMPQALGAVHVRVFRAPAKLPNKPGKHDGRSGRRTRGAHLAAIVVNPSAS